MQKATLAGGCFWCTEHLYLKQKGTLSIRSGYTGGDMSSPTYEQVSTGKTGHFEAIEMTFDPNEITYLQILELFWRNIDPTDAGGQFFDRGSQYRTAIFYHDAEQKKQAVKSKASLQSLFSEPIATEILQAKTFYPAEEYHQSYCRKNPAHFQSYQRGHLARLNHIWKGKKLPIRDLKEYLTPLQYHVTQEEGTESPFKNAYWDNKEEGIYVDIISGKPLFLSRDKYDSKTGWPSFSKPISHEVLIESQDYKLGVERTEVKCQESEAHLGHVFPDGPEPLGMRYCINSASLRFIPKERMKEEGYEELLHYFDT